MGNGLMLKFIVLFLDLFSQVTLANDVPILYTTRALLNSTADVSREQVTITSPAPQNNASYREQFASKVLEQHVRYCGSNRICEGRRPNRCLRCEPCRCDDVCIFYDDCCPDVILINPPNPSQSPPLQSCVPNLHGMYTTAQKQTRESNSSRYFVVTTCPEDADSTLKSACVVDTDLPFVTSFHDNITYLNKHCAKCHGVDSFSEWSTQVKCSVFTNFQKYKTSSKVLQTALEEDNCWVVFSPPRYANPRQCYMRDDMISSCNVTGDWYQYDAMLEQACQSYATVKTVESKIYRNVFCFICNSNNPKRYLFQKCKKSHGIVSFSALLDFSSALYDVDKVGNMCPEGQLFDGQTESCREIVCTQGKQLINRTCVPIFQSAKGLGYEIYFEMTSAEEFPLSGPEDLLHTLPARLNDYFPYALNMLITFHDFAVAFSTTGQQGQCRQTTSKLYLYATFITTGHVNLLQFESMLSELRFKNFTFQTESRNISFRNSPNEAARLIQPTHKDSSQGAESCMITVSMRQSMKTDNEEFERDSSNPFATDLKPIRISNLLSCPQIEIEEDEFEFISDRREIKLDWKDDPLQVGDYLNDDKGIIKICLKNFKPDALLVQNSSQHKDLGEVIVSVFCTGCSLLCLLLTFFTYSTFKSLRRIPGKNNINLTITLFMAQLIYLTGAGRTENKGLCEVLGIFIHYLWLAVVCAMAVCSFHMFRVFSTMRAREESSESRRRFLQYCVFIYAFPAVLVVATLVVHIVISEGASIGYGGVTCYLSTGTAVGIAFGLPVGLTVMVNLVFFLITIRIIRNSPKVEKSKQDEHHVIVYVKLSTLTGITWILGFLAFGFNLAVMRYIFIFINASQGVFIFVSFVCNRRVLKLISTNCCHHDTPKVTTGTTSSTSPTKSSTAAFKISKQETKLSNISVST